MKMIQANCSGSGSGRSKRPKLECLITKSYCESLLKEKSNRIKLVYYKGRSKVWDTFRRVFIDHVETKFVRCCLCSTILVYESISGTGSLLRHSCSKQQQQAVSQQHSLNLEQITEPFGYARVAITEAAVLCAAKDLRSLFFTQGPGFVQFAQSLIQIGAQCGNVSANTLLPTTMTISNTINIYCNRIKEKLKEELHSVLAFGFSCDYWVHHGCNNIHHFIIYIHFIKDGQLFKRLLGTVCGDNKSISNVSSKIDQLLIEFNIKDRKHFFIIESKMIDNHPQFGYYYDLCSADKLNQVIETTLVNCDQDPNLNNISKLISMCKKLIEYLKNGKIDYELNINIEQALGIHVGSTHAILDLVKANLDHFGKLSNLHPLIGQLVQKIDQDALTKLCEMLNEIKLAKHILTNGKEPTYYQVLLIKAKLLMNNQKDDQDDYLTQSIKGHIVKSINQHFDTSLYHICATLMVARFRRLNNICDESTRENGIQFLIKLAKNIRGDRQRLNLNSAKSFSVRAPDAMFECFTDPILPSPDQDDQENAEVREYLNFNFSIHDLSLNPIEFWNKKSVQFPILSKLAIWLHSIPATNESNSDYYSSLGFGINDRRNQVSSKQIDLLTFVRSNLDLIDI